MDNARINKMMWRWSIVSAGLIALFWTIWYLINGEVPTVNQINAFTGGDEDIIWTLPFGISRWWDVLLGLIGSIVLVKILTDKTIRGDKNLCIITAFGLVLGLVNGLTSSTPNDIICSLVYGPFLGLATCILFSIAFGLVNGLVYGLDFGIAFGLTFSIAFGLVNGLVYGLAFDMIYSPVFSMTFVLTYGLIYSIRSAGNYIWPWLMAKI